MGLASRRKLSSNGTEPLSHNSLLQRLLYGAGLLSFNFQSRILSSPISQYKSEVGNNGYIPHNMPISHQETVAKVQSRDAVRRQLWGVELENPIVEGALLVAAHDSSLQVPR